MKTNKLIRPHIAWLYIWIVGFSTIYFWCSQFLFDGSFSRLKEGLINSLIISVLSICFALFLAWIMVQFSFRYRENKLVSAIILFFMNGLKSIPQIIGLLICYFLVVNSISSKWSMIGYFSVATCFMIFKEMYDLMYNKLSVTGVRNLYNLH